MAISEEDIQKVREASDIVALFSERTQVRQRGKDYWCCCPFHNEKTPSCKIDPATQLWHCFGCGEGGDIFKYVMKSEDVSFPDAVRSLAQRAHIDIQDSASGGIPNSKKARLRDVCEETASFYHVQLMRSKLPQAQTARTYLGNRGLGGAIPKQWNLGFAPGKNSLIRHLRTKGYSQQDMIDANVARISSTGKLADRFYDRVMFPICDVQGTCIAFGGRVIGDGNPKYLNSQETPIFHKSEVLYGLDKAKSAMVASGCAIVVEGYTDVIALHTAGVCNAVATLGTALTRRHIRLLSRFASKKIIYLFDGDEAGQRAALRALEFIDETMTPEAGTSQVDLYAVTLPDNLDPADYVARYSGDQLTKLIDEALPLLAYGLERTISAYPLDTAESRSRALRAALEVLAPIKASVLAKDYAVRLSGRLGVREQDALELLSQINVPRRAFAEPTDNVTTRGSRQSLKSAQQQSDLPQSEINRLKLERETLGLCAQYPAATKSLLARIEEIDWHTPAHRTIAHILTQLIKSESSITPAGLIAQVESEVEDASSLLTTSTALDARDAKRRLSYVCNELELGDIEAEIERLKASLSQADSREDASSSELFQKIVHLQQRLQELKDVRKTLVEYT